MRLSRLAAFLSEAFLYCPTRLRRLLRQRGAIGAEGLLTRRCGHFTGPRRRGGHGRGSGHSGPAGGQDAEIGRQGLRGNVPGT
jgi:hypothetical protein